MLAKFGLRFVALGYLALILMLPVAIVFVRTFQHGLAPVVNAIQQPDFLHALYLTVLITLIVVPCNTVFGVITALVLAGCTSWLESPGAPANDAIGVANGHLQTAA